MDTYLKNKNYLNGTVSIYFPRNWTDGSSGTLDMDKGNFDSLIIKLLKRYGRYSKTSETLYHHNNLVYRIINGRKTNVLKRNCLGVSKVDGLLVEVTDNKNINLNSFPIINKYHNISKKNRIEYSVGDITISLVTESYADEDSKYLIEIYFTNSKVDHSKLKEIISFIESNL